MMVPALALAVIALAIAVGGAFWYWRGLDLVEEADARIVSDITILSSRVSGWVVKMPITEGSRVTRGQPLVWIDARETEFELRGLEMQQRGVVADRARTAAEIKMVDGRTRSGLVSKQSELKAAQALFGSLEHEFRFASDDFERAKSLSERGVIPTKELDRARTAYLRAEQGRLRAEAEVAAAVADLDAAKAERQRLEVLHAEQERLQIRADEIGMLIARKRLDIEDRAVHSPLNGVVSRTFVSVGEHVSPGQRIALLHDPNDIWVEALIKETSIRRLVVGQPVELFVDAYPDRRFSGTVERIGHAATSQFTLLPTPNPSGTFTKVTQRIPIRVTVDQVDDLLKPGMMVEVSIDAGKR